MNQVHEIEMVGLVRMDEAYSFDVSPEALSENIAVATLSLTRIMGTLIHLRAKTGMGREVAEGLIKLFDDQLKALSEDDNVSPIYYSAMSCVQASIETLEESFGPRTVIAKFNNTEH